MVVACFAIAIIKIDRQIWYAHFVSYQRTVYAVEEKKTNIFDILLNEMQKKRNYIFARNRVRLWSKPLDDLVGVRHLDIYSHIMFVENLWVKSIRHGIDWGLLLLLWPLLIHFHAKRQPNSDLLFIDLFSLHNNFHCTHCDRRLPFSLFLFNGGMHQIYQISYWITEMAMEIDFFLFNNSPSDYQN